MNEENKEQIIENKKDKNNDKTGNLLGLIALFLPLIGPIIMGIKIYSLSEKISYYMTEIGNLSPLASIVILIIGRIKYPNNTVLKGVMWFFIAIIIYSTIMFVIFHTMCDMLGCTDFPG